MKYYLLGIVGIFVLSYGNSIHGLTCYSCYGELNKCNNASMVRNKTCSNEEPFCIWYVNRGIQKTLSVTRDCTSEKECEFARRNDYGKIRCKLCNMSLCNNQELIGGSSQPQSLEFLVVLSTLFTCLYLKMEGVLM